MLSIGILSAGRGFYYTDLAREQYYTRGGEPPGQWWGRAATAFGFHGEVKPRELVNALEGFAPDGVSLVQNAGRSNRQAGLDLTFSAPKSVSVLWALSDPATRKELEQAHEQAVRVAIGYLESEAVWTRRGHGGTKLERAEMLTAAFQHGTSRAQDPNLHTHLLVLNAVLRGDGVAAALHNAELFLHKMAAGVLYRAELAKQLGPLGLGYELVQELGAPYFRLKGIPQKTCDEFSKRSQVIDDQLAETGRSSALDASRANLETRENKGHEPLAQLEPKWRAEAAASGFTLKRPLPRNAGKGVRPPHFLNTLTVVSEAASSLAEVRATFRKQDLAREALGACLNGTSDPQAVLRAVDSVLKSDHVRELGSAGGATLYTTASHLRNEKGTLALADELAKQPGLQVNFERAEKIKRSHLSELDTQERRAAFDYLTTSPGNIKVLNGLAGTGKTTLLRVVAEAWRTEGYQVYGMAVAGKAARELEQGAGIQSESVAWRRMELERSTFDRAREFYYSFKKPPKLFENKPAPMRLNAKSVLVVDEASMLGLEDTAETLKAAYRAGSKVVFVGDAAQLPAVLAVSPFEALGTMLEGYHLRDIRRQRHEWMRNAVASLAEGDHRSALELLHENNALHMSKGGPSATKAQLIKDWMAADRGDSPGLAKALLPDVLSQRLRRRDVSILTTTNADASDLNQRAQRARKQAGELGLMNVTLGSKERAHRGDRLLFSKTSKSMGVSNGDVGTIIKIHRPVNANVFDKGEVTVELDDSRRVRVNLNRYGDTALGYALTTHKSQGMTVDEAFVYTTPERAARDMLYVQVSRVREAAHVYTPGHSLGEDLDALDRSLERETRQRLAVEEQERLQMQAEQEKKAREAEEEILRNAQSKSFGLRRGLQR